MKQNIDRVNKEMVESGVQLFVGGLQPRANSKWVHWSSEGELSFADAPQMENQDFIDGFWILDVPSITEATEWGKKAALACGGSIEIRPFY